jgi:hypothetical protein
LHGFPRGFLQLLAECLSFRFPLSSPFLASFFASRSASPPLCPAGYGELWAHYHRSHNSIDLSTIIPCGSEPLSHILRLDAARCGIQSITREQSFPPLGSLPPFQLLL